MPVLGPAVLFLERAARFVRATIYGMPAHRILPSPHPHSPLILMGPELDFVKGNQQKEQDPRDAPP
eukprot:scaffold330_cov109-Isochrysis_galbana.AAC.5